MRHLGDHRHHQSCGCNAAAAAGGRRGFLQSFAAHFYPPEYQKAWLDWEDRRGIPHFTRQVGWSVQGALADTDAAGVRTAILSIASTPRGLVLPDPGLRGIEHGNAMRLLPRQQRA